MDIFVEFALVV